MIPTTAIVLDTRREKKDGLYPVKLRVTFQRKQKYYSIGYDLTPQDWEKVNGTKPRKDFKELQIKFSFIERKALTIIRDMPAFSFPAFEKRFLIKLSDRNNVYAAFETYIQQLSKEGRAGTASANSNSLASLRKFRKHLQFEDVTPDLLKKYEQWMLDNGNSLTTVGIYLRALRVIFNEAIEAGIIRRESYPFGKRRYQIPAGRNVKKALTLADIEKIFRYKAAPDWEERAKDFWLFSYLANGMNIRDIAHLRYRNIEGDKLTFIRHKTERTKRQQQKPIVVHLMPEALDIIKKWGNFPAYPDRYVFSILEDGTVRRAITPERELALVRQFTKMINTYIKRIAQAVDIDKNISTYTARHSFSTVLKRSGAPIEFISEALGHKDLRTTENYLDSFEDEVKKKYASILTSFNNGQLNSDKRQAVANGKDLITAAAAGMAIPAQDQ